MQPVTFVRNPSAQTIDQLKQIAEVMDYVLQKNPNIKARSGGELKEGMDLTDNHIALTGTFKSNQKSDAFIQLVQTILLPFYHHPEGVFFSLGRLYLQKETYRNCPNDWKFEVIVALHIYNSCPVATLLEHKRKLEARY